MFEKNLIQCLKIAVRLIVLKHQCSISHFADEKATRVKGLLCRWPSITEWEMYITAQGPRLRNDLYGVEWAIKL